MLSSEMIHYFKAAKIVPTQVKEVDDGENFVVLCSGKKRVACTLFGFDRGLPDEAADEWIAVVDDEKTGMAATKTTNVDGMSLTNGAKKLLADLCAKSYPGNPNCAGGTHCRLSRSKSS